jgi:hypothetical protein
MLIRADKRRDGRKDMTKVLDIFREHEKAPNNNDTYQYRHTFYESYPLAKNNNNYQYFQSQPAHTFGIILFHSNYFQLRTCIWT